MENSATGADSEGGGGLAYCDGMIKRNTIAGNSAERDGGGLAKCNGTVQNNIVAGNSGKYGGGLYQCAGTIRDNTICDNRAEKGGGVAWCNGAIVNCIIHGNTAPTGSQTCYSIGPTYSCIQGWVAGGTGNIAPPSAGFVDPDGPDDDPLTFGDNDYHLAADSPCIDGGGNEEWMWAEIDRDGNPRIFPATGKFSWWADMGAYEYIPLVYPFTACIRRTGAAIQIVWTSHPQETFSVSSCVDLPANGWIEEEASIVSGGLTTSWTGTMPDGRAKFYRVDLK
jgi:hypothetical protein